MIWADKFFWIWQYKDRNSLFDDMKTKLFQRYENKDQEAVNSLLNEWWKSSSSSGGGWVSTTDDLYSKYNTHLFSDSFSGEWTQHPFNLWNNQSCKFWDLNITQQEKIIEDINNMPQKGDRDRFGNSSTNVIVWTWSDAKEYEFDRSESKYKKRSATS